jgi:hypothetical protein
MAVSNRERVGRALESLRAALLPFVEQELRSAIGEDWKAKIPADAGVRFENGLPQLDTQALIKVVMAGWTEVFSVRYGREVLNLFHDARETRNKFAHDAPFETDDAFNALHQMQRLLESIGASVQADEVERMKTELLRQRFEEQARREQRKATVGAIEGVVLGGLKPWREIIAPHEDVAKGTYQQAEFAADLWQVYQKQGAPEYLAPT